MSLLATSMDLVCSVNLKENTLLIVRSPEPIIVSFLLLLSYRNDFDRRAHTKCLQVSLKTVPIQSIGKLFPPTRADINRFESL